MTTELERAWLLQIARDAITAHVTGSPQSAVGRLQSAVGSRPSAVGGLPSTPVEGTALDDRLGGVFVTLHRRGELRGCIGHMEPDDVLARLVERCAVAACSTDPRFPPVAPGELPEIHIELSLLGPLEPVVGPADIEVGRHGLVVEMGRQRGLLLPQVATEWQWDARTFLTQTCRKAGLPADCWQRGAAIWRFEAEVFSESIP